MVDESFALGQSEMVTCPWRIAATVCQKEGWTIWGERELLKVRQGSTIRTAWRQVWRTLGTVDWLVTCPSGPLQHCHEIVSIALSLVLLQIQAIKKHLERQLLSVAYLHAVFWSVWTARAQKAVLGHARAAWTGKYIQKYAKIPLLASNFSNN